MSAKIETSLVSIIMPAFNAEIFISESIRSVIEQNHQDFELLVINDGSNDKTEDEILKFKDDRIKYFKQKNRGVSSARNVGLNNMKGDFFCFLDADDILTRESITSRIKIFKNYSNAKFVDGSVRLKSENLNKTIRLWKPVLNNENPKKYLTSLNGNCFLGQTWLIRNSYSKIRFNEELTHCEDLLYFILLSDEGGLYFKTNKEILIYRKHNKSAMNELDLLYKAYKNLYYLLNKHEIKLDYKYLHRKINLIMLKSYFKNFKILRGIKAALNYIFGKFLY